MFCSHVLLLKFNWEYFYGQFLCIHKQKNTSLYDVDPAASEMIIIADMVLK